MKTTLIIFIGAVLLLASSCQRDKIDTDLLNTILESQHHAALQLEEDNDILYRNAQYLLMDESKKRYQPVRKFLVDVRATIDSIRNELQEVEATLGQPHQSVETLRQPLIDFHDLMLNEYEKLLWANDSIFFLREEGIQARCNGLAKAVSFISETDQGLLIKKLTIVERKAVLQKTILDLNILEARLHYYIASLFDGRPICGFSVFELVVYKNSNSTQNQGNTLIMIEEYPSPSQAENIHLTINGEKVFAYHGLYITYPDSLLKIHHNTLEFSGEYFNHLTGEKNELLPYDPYILRIE